MTFEHTASDQVDNRGHSRCHAENRSGEAFNSVLGCMRGGGRAPRLKLLGRHSIESREFRAKEDVAGKNVKIQRHPGLFDQAPERFVDRQVVGEPGVRAGHHQRAEARGQATLGFGHRSLDMVGRDEPHWQTAHRIRRKKFADPVVVDPGQAKIHLGVVQTTQAQQVVGENHFGVDTVGQLVGPAKG